MRKIAFVAAVAVAAVSTPALAKGPYVGVGVTHENTSAAADLEGAGFSGIGGTVFAGYSLPVGETVFVGVEANFDLSSAKFFNTDENVGLESDHAYGISGRLGVNLNEKTSLYGRVGYQRGRHTATDATDTTKAALKTKTSYDGLRLGAGLSTAVTEKVSLRGEYSRTHYSLNKAQRDELAPQKGGFNNDQFQLSVVLGF